MFSMKKKDLPDGFIVIEELDNSEWVAGVKRGEEKLSKGKMFIMLDKNKSAEENLKIIKRATDT
jgi:hypothetical protein